jgi:Tfp pilus assembly protein FimT
MRFPFSRRRSGSNPRRRPQAFTLVELMVIVAVIGIVTGVAFTSMAAFLQEQKLRQAAAELASYLQSARAKAQREGASCELAFSGLSSTVIAPTTAAGNVCNSPPLQAGLNLTTVSGASGLKMEASTPTIPNLTFTRSGTLASDSVSSSTVVAMPRLVYLSASGTSQQRCVFLDLVGIRIGWRTGTSGACSYGSG